MGRVVVLTTHFMDEAEVLGDRVAIMSSGKLRCVGSPLWLKARFGIGYNLSVTLKSGMGGPATTTTGAVAASPVDGMMFGATHLQHRPGVEKTTTTPKNNVVVVDTDVTALVKKHVPLAEVVSHIAREVTFRLPRQATGAFAALFEALETVGKAKLGVGDFGVGVTTLEEVFIRIADEDEAREAGLAPGSNAATNNAASTSDPATAASAASASVSSLTSVPTGPVLSVGSTELKRPGPLREVCIQFNKRATVFRRDPKGAFFQFCVPLLLVTSILAILTIDVQPAGPTLRGKPSAFRKRSASQVSMAWKRPLKTTSSDDGLGSSASANSSSSSNVDSSGVGEGYFCSSSLLSKLEADLQLKLPPGHRAADPKPPSWVSDVITLDTNPDLGENSYNMSEYFLDTYEGAGARFGGFVCEDEFPTSVTVDWKTMFELVPGILKAFAGTPGERLLEEWVLSNNPFKTPESTVSLAQLVVACNDLIAGVDETEEEGAVSTLDAACTLLQAVQTSTTLEANNLVQDLGSTSASDAKGLLADTLNSTLGLNSKAIQDLFEAFNVAEVLNTTATLAELFESTFGIAFNLTSVDNTTAVTLPAASVGFSSFDISDDGNSVTVANVYATIDDDASNTTTFTFGNLTLTSEQLIEVAVLLVGEGIEVYDFTLASPTDLTILHNASAWHALFMFHGFAREAAYADRCFDVYNDELYEQNNEKTKEKHSYVVRNHPLPLTTRQVLEIRFILSIFASLFVLIALCYAPAAFVTFVVRERQCKSKHLQMVSGANVYLYWVATYLWDAFVFLLFALCVMAVLACYGISQNIMNNSTLRPSRHHRPLLPDRYYQHHHFHYQPPPHYYYGEC